MATRYFDIVYQTRQRIGYYKDEKGVSLITIVKWHKQAGDIIQGVEDRNTGIIHGEEIVTLNAAKGNKTVEAVGWEIGAKILKICMPEGSKEYVDLSEEPLRLALLEVPNGIEETTPETKPSETRITPLAEEAGRERGVSLDDVRASLPGETAEITYQDVEAYRRDIFAAPKTRQFAKEYGINLGQVAPSGAHGVVTLNDVEREIAVQKSRSEKTPNLFGPDFSETEIRLLLPEEVLPSSLQFAVASNLRRSRDQMVLVGGGIDVNARPMLALRSRLRQNFQKVHDIDLRPDHFVLAASAYLLKDKRFERLNARWEWLKKGARIVYYRHINIGIAVANRNDPDDLKTPVIHFCENKRFAELAKSAEEVIARALTNQLSDRDQQGLTFIVNNTGAVGDEYPGPIPSPDISCILAFGRARQLCTCPDLANCPHDFLKLPMMLTLKFDHQLINGHVAGPFLTALRELLENPEQILLL